MQAAVLPADEAERLQTLRRYEILDTLPEQAFDDLTLLAARICDTPIALVSLIDQDRQWFKSRVGLDTTETPRDLAFCAHAILQTDIFIVPDALEDARFRDNPLVVFDPLIRFYVGAPLITADGHVLGTLCAIDRRPRQLEPGHAEALRALSRQVVSQLELRRSLKLLERSFSQISQAQNTLASQAKELQRSNKALEQFAYIASHDLQEPLRTIQAYGGILKDESEAVLSPSSREYLDYMLIGAARMSTLVSDLLAYARVTTTSQPFEPVELGQIARNVMADLKERIRETRALVEIGELPRIEADPLQMHQLLQNLIGNALKFHRDSVPPIVQIQGRKLPGNEAAGLRADSNRYEITVRDNGIGIDENLMGRLFTPFQRLVSREQFEGSGIGLAICKTIVERHGGSIGLRSKLGEGTTFIIELPATHPKSAVEA